MREHILNSDPIGVFDSGIGGLTVVKEISKKLPNESIVYFGDTARVPYGTKSKKTIIKFAREDIDFLLENNVKIIVSACFSVSSNALPHIRNEIEVPIIDMISPGVQALKNKTYKKIGVIGTEATIESGTFERELKKSNKNLEIYSKACPLFVPLAEEGWTTGEVPLLASEKYLSNFLDKGIEALILGCTHYPLLYSVIRKVLGEKIDIIEPGKEVALIIKNLLLNKNLESDTGGNLKVYLSDIPRNFDNIAKKFLGQEIKEVNLISSE